MPNRDETESRGISPLISKRLGSCNEDLDIDISLADDNIGRGFYRGFGRGFRRVIIQGMKSDIGQNYENRPKVPESRDNKS